VSLTPVIDIHSHFFPESWPDFDIRFGGPPWPAIRHDGPGKATIMIGDTPFRPIESACWDVERRLADMDRDGVDIQVMSATPVLFAYERPADQALEVAKVFNDAARTMAERGGGRIETLCQVPLQDPDAACREVSRAMAAGISACKSATMWVRAISTIPAFSPFSIIAPMRAPPCSSIPGT